jgi:type VI secretion system protein ImpI/type VI secretion system protein
MRLTLSILRCPASAPTETRVFEGGQISIGRGPENDWVLPDPDRHLSKRHCMLAFHGGDWQLADTSTNGTYLNGESEPLGQGMPRRLRDGDRLRFGAYEIEARIGPSEPAPQPWSDPFADDPFAPPRPQQFEAGLQEPQSAGISLPADFDPMAPEQGGEDWSYPTQGDHSPSTDDAFRPAPTVAALPDDWADDLLGSAPLTPAPQPAPQPSSRPVAPPPAPTAFPEDSFPESSFDEAPFTEPPVAPAREPPPVAAVPAASAPMPPPAVAAPSAPADDSALIAAFLRGVGLPGTAVDDPETLMVQTGEMLRAMVSGLRHALIARSEIKSEFRIERTMISARNNNPLKFSADDDDALDALVGPRRRANVPPAQAVTEALRDMRLHELATMAAMQTAVRALVASLDPEMLKTETRSGALPIQRKARAWDAFEALHAKVTQNLADDFDSVFGKSFARAYEQAQSELAGKEGPL